LTSDMVVIPL